MLDKNEFIAAIDLGTYGCRMLVGVCEKIEHSLSVRVVSRFSQTVRINVKDDGTISAKTLERIIKALSYCESLLKKFNVSKYICVGTAACRLIKDKDHFLSLITKKTNIKINIINPKKEIIFSAYGASVIFNHNFYYKLIFDIGGGSTEIGLFTGDNIANIICVNYISLPYGVLNLQTDNKSIELIVKELQAGLYTLLKDLDLKNNKIQVIGTSGPLSAIVTLSLGLKGYHGPQMHGLFIDHETVNYWINKIDDNGFDEFCQQYGVSYPTIVSIPLLKIISNTVKTSMYVSNTGVRNGILNYLALKNNSF